MRLKSFDNLLIGTMSFVALICVYMLYGAKYFNHPNGPDIKIASIVEQIKTVKRKRDFYQSWVDVSPGDSLSQNDEIYTHGQSSAKINFVNGPEISLFENSLLRIKAKTLGNTLTLEKGNLSARLTPTSPNLDVVLNGKKYSFESKNANIQIEQGKTENKFMLLDGRAKIKINQEAQELSPNQILIQNKETGKVKIKELPFVLKGPIQNLTQYFVNQQAIDFNWNYTSGPTPLKITIARDSIFSDILETKVIDTDHYTQSFNKAGTYYWKISSANDIEDLSGPIRSFTLKEEHAPEVTIDKNILYIGPKKAEKVFINWSKESAKNFVLKIENPNKKIETLELAQNNFDLQANLIGTYNVSVKINEDLRPLALWSAPTTIEVLEAKSISITSITSEIIEKVNYNNQPLTQILSWNGPSSDVTYKIKLTKDSINKNFETTSTTFPLILNSPGEYKWEIIGESSAGILTNSIHGKILLQSPMRLAQTPAEGAVIELDKPDQLVSFKWDQIENTKEYQLELSNESSFQKIVFTKDSESNNLSTTIAQIGRYYWRVKIKKGNKVEYSNPVSVEIKPSPPLERPEISPNIKIKIKYLDDKTTNFHLIDLLIAKAFADDPIAVAEWDLPANSRAKNYIVEVYEDQKLTKLIKRIEASSPHVVWKNATIGKFYWRVSYEDYWGRKTDFSKIAVLEAEIDPAFIKPEPPKAVEKLTPPPIYLVSPKHRENILENSEDEAEFQWEAIPETKIYELDIASDLEFEKMIFKTKLNQTTVKIRCKDLKETAGDYYWKVLTNEGSSSKRRMLHANCLPKTVISPPEPIVVAKKEEISIVAKNLKFARLGFYPHHLTYTNTASAYTAKVSGNALNSWYGMYQAPVDWKFFQLFNSTFYISRGKVFKSTTFTDMELNFKVHRFSEGLSWGPVFAFIKKTLYVESNLAITSATHASPLLGAFIQKNFEKVTINAEAKFGGTLDLHADLLMEVKKNIMVGPFIDSTTLTKDTNKHSFSRFGMNLSYTFPLN